MLLFTLFCCCRGSCCYLHLSRRSASGLSQLFGPAFRRFHCILKNLLKVVQPIASSTCLHHSLNLLANSLSLQSLSSCDCINRSSSPVCFPSLTPSVGTQVSRRRLVNEGFICTLKSHGLCPVPLISSTVSNRSLTYMPSMTQCKRSFGSVT